MRFKYWRDFLSLVLPETCCLCKRSLFPFEDQLCKICVSQLPVTNYHLIPEENDLKIKLLGLAPVNKVMAYLRFSKKGYSQKLLHQIKYKNKAELARVLGLNYGFLLKKNGYKDVWDYIVPVPLHERKLQIRGYNQSEQFAIGLADALETECKNLLLRKLPTETQTNKSRIERWENVSEVFETKNKDEIKDNSLLLVDDVMTTGATLASCAISLNSCKPRSIDMAVLAAGSYY
ncbi:ComF family protein [Cyclobacterium amurskyense]|uniref:Phosphoribosyltransferase n=1 Tax=Cyclobacterium amurskyense TaxID=320787 RepID=A0A0H4PDE2_9BACT|nr:phosphoribosyltransferase family protein [Cyclobacterium amurskyense]AKP51145.1 Phosphoribosyltransferase [Cyclobacterium amurskyense]|tara:strand:- start:7198 stop:7896 length:699 start_codon:yes stop_codon:yes gene_type:complete